MENRRETTLFVRMSKRLRRRLEQQAQNANRSMTAQITWWIETTELDGITQASTHQEPKTEA